MLRRLQYHREKQEIKLVITECCKSRAFFNQNNTLIVYTELIITLKAVVANLHLKEKTPRNQPVYFKSELKKRRE